MQQKNDLPELINIIDEIVVNEEEAGVGEKGFGEKDFIELFETCLHMIQEYMDDNPNAISDPDFRETIEDEVYDVLEMSFEEAQDDIGSGICKTEEYLCDTLAGAIEYYFEYICLPRCSLSGEMEKDQHLSVEQYIIEMGKVEALELKEARELKEELKEEEALGTSQEKEEEEKEELKEREVKEEKKKKTREQIAYLESLPQPAQRTPEWYVYRHNLITASNAYKAFDSQAGKNALIYEKCKPISMISSGNVSVSSPMHWGQKYEAVSVSIYETKYNAIITDFGCIQHRKYSFVGASPDGINTDESSPNYGRMLEIKNPTTRVITGEPKKEYWVQCQLQMETCDLDECDFLETKFAEYENEEAFNLDGAFLMSEKQEIKGIMMYFADQEGAPKYVYKPLTMEKEEFVKWEEEMMEKYEGEHNYTWIKNNYWKLAQLSCVLIKRNVVWFQANIHALDELWRIVLQERITGYSHRAPKPRVKGISNAISLATSNAISLATITSLEVDLEAIEQPNQNKMMRYVPKTNSPSVRTGCMLKLLTNPLTGVTVVKSNE